MIADIANELHRVRRQLRASMLHGQGSAVMVPDWLIEQALRVEVNEYDFYEHCWRNGGNEAPTEIMGVRVYVIPPRFEQLPAPGWRIIDPFNKPAPKVPDYGSPYMAPERG